MENTVKVQFDSTIDSELKLLIYNKFSDIKAEFPLPCEVFITELDENGDGFVTKL